MKTFIPWPPRTVRAIGQANQGRAHLQNQTTS
jgi:hypothetical protein